MLALLWTRTSALTAAMRAASMIGAGAIELPLALIFALTLASRGRARDAKRYAGAALGGWVLYGLAKLALHRARPHVTPHLMAGAGWYSYPSGHSMMAAVVFGLAAVVWSSAWRSQERRAALVVLAAVASIVIAFSRVDLGVHYPSDVAGGLLLGTAWSGFWISRWARDHVTADGPLARVPPPTPG